MRARDDCKSCGASSADKCVCGVHTCSYECERPSCVRRQRDELRNTLYARDDKKVELPEPVASAYRKCMRSASRSNWVVYPGKAEDDEDWVNLYTAAQLESYAAARVAEATAELQKRVAELEDESGHLKRVIAKGCAWPECNCPSSVGTNRTHCERLPIQIVESSDILADREGGKA